MYFIFYGDEIYLTDLKNFMSDLIPELFIHSTYYLGAISYPVAIAQLADLLVYIRLEINFPVSIFCAYSDNFQFPAADGNTQTYGK
jgi:hypothetical protein